MKSNIILKNRNTTPKALKIKINKKILVKHVRAYISLCYNDIKQKKRHKRKILWDFLFFLFFRKPLGKKFIVVDKF